MAQDFAASTELPPLHEHPVYSQGMDQLATGRWQQAFLHFARKLSLRFERRPLVFKSPCHTARISLLLEIFPDGVCDWSQGDVGRPGP